MKDPDMNRAGWDTTRWVWYWEELNHALGRKIVCPPVSLHTTRIACRDLEECLRHSIGGNEAIITTRLKARERTI